MSFERDAARIARVVRSVDPAFGAVPDAAISAAEATMLEAAAGTDAEGFLLAAMRLVALADNAHSRVIPNAAISVLSQRFVVRDGRLSSVVSEACVPVVAVNDVPVDTLLQAWAPYLPGRAAARKTVLAGLMLAWPAALDRAGVSGPRFAFRLEDGTVLSCHRDDTAPAPICFAENETGARAVGADAFPAPLFEQVEGVWHLRLSDLKALTPDDVARATAAVSAVPAGVVLDLRGNPGGSFLTALPLIDLLKSSAFDHRCAVLINAYTFSAAIVVAVLVKHHMGDRAALIGSEMGDDLAFWAEGDLMTLSDSGAKLRYSTGWHDWRTGRADPTTPADIAQHLVAGGDVAVQGCPEAEQMRAARTFVLAW